MPLNQKQIVDLYNENLENENRIKSVKESLIKDKQKKQLDEEREIMEMTMSTITRAQRATAKREGIKHTLLSEAMYGILDKSLGIQIRIPQTEALKKNLIDSFIKEQGVNKLLNSFTTKTYLLSEYSRIINKYTEVMVESDCNKEECDDDIASTNSDLRDAFNSELSNDDQEEVIAFIKTRVDNTMNEFITNNMVDKAEIQEILQKYQEKMDSAKTEAARESCDMLCKREITRIRNKREKNILESMIGIVCANTLKDDATKKLYSLENGKLDMDKIVESCGIMYTFLEMLNTSKIVKVDENLIQDTLDSLKI